MIILVEKHKAIVDDITSNCDGITVDNICTDFNWDGYTVKLGPPPPMGPTPEETPAPVESTTTVVTTTQT